MARACSQDCTRLRQKGIERQQVGQTTTLHIWVPYKGLSFNLLLLININYLSWAVHRSNMPSSGVVGTDFSNCDRLSIYKPRRSRIKSEVRYRSGIVTSTGTGSVLQKFSSKWTNYQSVNNLIFIVIINYNFRKFKFLSSDSGPI